jgi:Ankyrin repeats (3 copies)/Ankyrin repeat
MIELIEAVVRDDRDRVRRLLKADPDLATGRFETARLFTSQICHWLYAGDSVLHLAAAGYRVEIVKLLLAAGAEPDVPGPHRWGRPLHYAADGYSNPVRQVNAIQTLIAAGADVEAADKNGATPLHRAVRTRSAAAVECLLDAGADPTTRNKPGSTPFHLAVQDTGHGGTGNAVARAGQEAIIRIFLSRGVRPTLKDGRGKTVRQWAKSDWVRTLLENS